MYLKRIDIINYRNIRQATMEFSPYVNCLLGDNGEGKTNILDAVYYLSFCKSSANMIDSQNIHHDEEFFLIQGSYLDGEREEEISCGLKRRQKKSFKRNKKEYERLSQHIGLVPLVMIAPDDISLIVGGSDERRRFMDQIVSQARPSYMEALINYNRVLVQRNVLLKNEEAVDRALLAVIDEQMEAYARTIYEWRMQCVQELVPLFQQTHRVICNEKESVSLSYQSTLGEGPLTEQLRQRVERDVMLGYTTRGIHKDELEMLMGDLPLKRVASQGQIKSYLIALKLAQALLLIRWGCRKPILLLDDIFDKLDTHRVSQIIQLVAEGDFGQTFITDTNREHLEETIQALHTDYKLFHLKQGEAQPIER